MTNITEINKAIQVAIAKVNAQKHGKLQEPDYTAALALEFPKEMNKTKVFPNIKFGGCFIHQSPIVQFDSPHNQRGCELGDLLVLLRKRTKDDVRYNAALIQLKISDISPATLHGEGDLKQLYLYEKWPVFTIISTGERYDLFPKTVTQGALYSIVQRKSVPQFFMAEPESCMAFSGDMTFGRFIQNAINWQAGRTVADESSKPLDEWSRLIWDLIKQSAHKVFNRKNIGWNNCPRLSDCFLNYMTEDNSIKIPTNGENEIGDGEGTGISTLIIDIDEIEPRERNKERKE